MNAGEFEKKSPSDESQEMDLLHDAIRNAETIRDNADLPAKLRIAAAKHHLDLLTRAWDMVLSLLSPSGETKQQ